MLGLIVFTPIVFNLRNILGVGIFNVEDDYFNSYSDGTAGINMHLRFEHEVDTKYFLFTFIEPISTGSVANYGLLSINFYFLKDNEQKYATSIQFDTPQSTFSMNRIYLGKIDKYSNLTCYGMIELSLETGGIPINATINFQLTYIFPMGIEDYYNLDLVIYLLTFLQFFLYVIIPVTLNWIFKPIFGLKYSEDDMKRDERFLKYLHKHLEEKRKETKN